MKLSFVGLLGLLMVSAAQAQSGDEYNLACIKSLVLLPYPPIARQARVTGEVSVEVTVSKVGGAEKIEFVSAQPKRLLADPVKEYLTKAQYDPTCVGKAVRLRFVFEVHEELPPVSTTDAKTEVVFKGPNTFIIATPPGVVMF